MNNAYTVRLLTDDSIELELKENGLAYDISGMTRVTINIDGTTYDSATLGGVGAGEEFDVSQGATGKLILRLGNLTSPPSAGFHPDCLITLFDASNPNGIPWTPTILIRAVGPESFTAVYAVKGSMLARYPFDELVQLTDLANSGEIDDLALYEALQAADAEIDAYLAQRYTLPLDNVPTNLERVACEIARYRLYRDGAPESVRDRYTDARSYLKDVASGKLQIGVASNNEAPATATLPVLHQKIATELTAPAGRVFSMHPDHNGPFN